VSYVGAVGRRLRRLGYDPQPLYARFGWSAQSVEQGQIRVPLAEFFALLEAAAGLAGDPHFGLHIYEHFDFADLGLLGFAVLSAQDVGSALRILMRYGAIFQDCDDGQLLVDGELAYISYRVSSRTLPSSRHDCDMSMAFMVFFLRKVVEPDWVPLAVQLQHPTPSPRLLSEYEGVFRSPIRFGAATNQMTMPSSILSAPIRSCDKRLFDIIERNLSLLQEHSLQSGSFAQKVEAAITQKLSVGPPSVATVARLLGLTPRALQRELAAHSLKFNELTDKARCGMARRLLATSDRSLAEITYLLGYSEESAFIRAFRRWMSCTPVDYRRSLLAPATPQ
jgi:AraC-like DNA-binding protein